MGHCQLPYSHHHSLSPSHLPQEEASHQTPGSCPGSFKDKKRDATPTSWQTSYTPKNAYTTALRYLATGETYTSLQYHWLVGHTTICKFVPKVCRAILAEFQDKFLCCCGSPEKWKRVEKFRTRWNVPNAVGAIDGKHLAMKKPKKSGSDYYNYKGFFFLVLLVLVDAEYRFFWIDCGSSGS